MSSVNDALAPSASLPTAKRPLWRGLGFQIILALALGLLADNLLGAGHGMRAVTVVTAKLCGEFDPQQNRQAMALHAAGKTAVPTL